MGELRNCPICGKVFIKLGKNLCPDCMEKEEQEYKEVRQYLKENPGASVMEIKEITGIDENKILKWIREGRIDTSSIGPGAALTCKSCGTQITVGNLCLKCAQLLAKEIKTISHGSPGKDEKTQKPMDLTQKGMIVAEKIRKN